MRKTHTETPSLRVNAGNPNHHLYLNNGTWWLHYTVHIGPKKERCRRSLHTRNVEVARRQRDRRLGSLLGRRSQPALPSANERRAA